jgi:hypothetical protein
MLHFNCFLGKVFIGTIIRGIIGKCRYEVNVIGYHPGGYDE